MVKQVTRFKTVQGSKPMFLRQTKKFNFISLHIQRNSKSVFRSARSYFYNCNAHLRHECEGFWYVQGTVKETEAIDVNWYDPLKLPKDS